MPETYQIQIEGRIGQRWANWFEGMIITLEERGDATVITTLIGPIADQAALLGLLQKLYSLGFSLNEVKKQE
jgi:hypothetical protein